MENTQTVQKISIRALVKEAYALVQKNPLSACQFIFLIVFVPLVVMLLGTLLTIILPGLAFEALLVESNTPLFVLWGLWIGLGMLCAMFLSTRAYYYLSFSFVDEKPFLWQALWPTKEDWRKIGAFFILNLVFMLLIMLSFVAFFIPFLFVFAGLWPVMVKAFDEKNFSLSQIQASWSLTQGNRMAVWKLMLLALAVYILFSVVLGLVPSQNMVWMGVTAVFMQILMGVLYILHVFLYRKLSPKK